ncbi:signal peptidase II [Sphingomonas sp. ASV193]|uniref:signal peptidase II n=1 Tax=Sphingomonas sp. ASV193 TaxID=3144405 RepID=UPI0032E87BA6
MTSKRGAYIFALIVFAVDQLSKWLVTGPLGVRALGDQKVLLPIFNLTYVENRGISLGYLHADGDTGRWLLVAATTAIAIGVAWWIRREDAPGERIALAMILGGALGNILDRARQGFVTDFLDLHFGEWRPFLVFNVSDAAISIGVAILLIRAVFVHKKPANTETTHA